MDCAVVEQLVLSTANVAKSRYTIIILSIIIRLARSAAAALHVQLITMIVIARGIGLGGGSVSYHCDMRLSIFLSTSVCPQLPYNCELCLL